MRVANIIMAHKSPAQLQRLLKKLEHPNFDFFIHLDKKVPLDDFKHLANADRVFFIKKRTDCNWGGNSLTDGILTSIKEIQSLSQKYDFINLMSGQDYPVQSADKIYEYLSQNQGYNFISYEEEENSAWWKSAVSRYEKYHLTDFSFKGKYFIEKLLNLLLPKRKFPKSFRLYGSSKSTWWTISSKCAFDVVAILEKEHKLNRFLKYCWGTDEFLIPTIIMNSQNKEKTINNNFRYIDWSEGNAHPKTLGLKDFDSIKGSSNLFARKFDIQYDEKILDKLDTL